MNGVHSCPDVSSLQGEQKVNIYNEQRWTMVNLAIKVDIHENPSISKTMTTNSQHTLSCAGVFLGGSQSLIFGIYFGMDLMGNPPGPSGKWRDSYLITSGTLEYIQCLGHVLYGKASRNQLVMRTCDHIRDHTLAALQYERKHIL